MWDLQISENVPFYAKNNTRKLQKIDSFSRDNDVIISVHIHFRLNFGLIQDLEIKAINWSVINYVIF